MISVAAINHVNNKRRGGKRKKSSRKQQYTFYFIVGCFIVTALFALGGYHNEPNFLLCGGILTLPIVCCILNGFTGIEVFERCRVMRPSKKTGGNRGQEVLDDAPIT